MNRFCGSNEWQKILYEKGKQMIPYIEQLKQMGQAKDSKYISGIYNYCDRWCERCPFTSRCLNCSLVKEQFGDLEKIDELNEAF